MKTQILQLEPHDDFISVRDKIGWGQTRRILLVWPARRRFRIRELDLLLLQRHGSYLGAQIALVTHDPDATFHARRLGIDVYKSVQGAQSTRWRSLRRLHRTPYSTDAGKSLEEEREQRHGAQARLAALRESAYPSIPSWVRHPATRFGLFAISVFSVLAIAGVLLPRAEIVLEPQRQTQSVTFTAQSSINADAISLSGIIPARSVSVIVEGRDTQAASGTVVVPNTAASGVVRFRNLTDQPITIPAGTIVRTLGEDAVRFETTASGSLRGGVDQSVEVPIVALERGRQGNVSAGEIEAVEGPLGLKLTVDNPATIRGGRDFTTTAPSENDRTDLFEALLNSLRQTATLEIDSLLSTGDVVLTPVPRLIKVHQQNYDPSDVAPSDELNLTLRVEFQAWVASQEDMLTLSEAILNTRLPEGFTAVADSLALNHLTDPIFRENNRATWRIQAQREILAELEDERTLNITLGLSPSEASERLTQELLLETAPKIRLTPAWWPRLPILPFRIQINQDLPTASVPASGAVGSQG